MARLPSITSKKLETSAAAGDAEKRRQALVHERVGAVQEGTQARIAFEQRVLHEGAR